MSVKVTTRTVDAIKPQRRDVFLWDGELAGFGVRVTPGGARSYIYQYRLGGRGSASRRYTIGRHRSPWTAQTARVKAGRLAEQVAKGKDPVRKRQERRRKEVELRFDAYVEFFTETYLKYRWKDWERIHTMLVFYAVPVIGTKKITDIKRADLSEVYRRLDNKPSVARAMHATLRKMFNWAMTRDDIKHSPAKGAETPPRARPRTRYLSNNELRCAWSTSFQLPGHYGHMFRMMMLTGQRRGEVAGLDWSELNQDRREWVLPAERAKNGYMHLVPLGKQARALLDGMAGGGKWPLSGLVFRSTSGTPLSGFSKIKKVWDNKILKKLRQQDEGVVVAPWRLHDLRRTVATGLQALAVPREVIEAVLNHVSSVRGTLVGVYQCYQYQEERRLALKAWGRHVKALESVTNSGGSWR